MSDSDILNQFMESSNYQPSDKIFTDDSWRYTNEISGAGAVSNMLYFDTKSMKSQIVDWQSAYLMLPLRLQSDGTTKYTDATLKNLALKGSVLSLINSVTVNSGSGTNLGVNDNNVHLINNMRLLLDESVNWSNSMGAELCYAKDITNTADSSANAGLLARSNFMTNQSTALNADAVYNYIDFNAIIPLRYVHDFFDKLGLQVNSHFQINFGLNFQNSVLGAAAPAIINGFAPFTVHTGTPYPNIIIGTTRIPTARIYYRNLKLNSPYAEQLLNKVKSGNFKKRIHFTVTDLASVLSTDKIASGSASNPINKTVSTSTVKPLRLIVLPIQTGSLASKTLPAPFICTGRLQKTNIKVNDEQYFNSPLENDNDHWQQVCKSLPGYGINSMEGNQLSFSDFVGDSTSASAGGSASYKIYCFDISKLRERLVNPDSAVTIEFASEKIPIRGSTTCDGSDFYYLVEREALVELDFGSNEIEYRVGLTGLTAEEKARKEN